MVVHVGTYCDSFIGLWCGISMIVLWSQGHITYQDPLQKLGIVISHK